MTEKFELKDHPSVSYGNHLEDKELVVIRVNEGEFENTVFNFKDVGGLDEIDDGSSPNVTYSLEFQLFCHNGEYFDASPDEAILTKFYETVASPMLYNILIKATELAKE